MRGRLSSRRSEPQSDRLPQRRRRGNHHHQQSDDRFALCSSHRPYQPRYRRYRRTEPSRAALRRCGFRGSAAALRISPGKPGSTNQRPARSTANRLFRPSRCRKSSPPPDRFGNPERSRPEHPSDLQQVRRHRQCRRHRAHQSCRWRGDRHQHQRGRCGHDHRSSGRSCRRDDYRLGIGNNAVADLFGQFFTGDADVITFRTAGGKPEEPAGKVIRGKDDSTRMTGSPAPRDRTNSMAAKAMTDSMARLPPIFSTAARATTRFWDGAGTTP